jgi:hypothetical protein
VASNVTSRLADMRGREGTMMSERTAARSLGYNWNAPHDQTVMQEVGAKPQHESESFPAALSGGVGSKNEKPALTTVHCPLSN